MLHESLTDALAVCCHMTVASHVFHQECSIYIGNIAEDRCVCTTITTRNVGPMPNVYAQRDGHPAEYRWRRLFKATKFG